MIELIEGLPENVIGIVAKGRLTKQDCSEVLVPTIERALEWHHKLRLYYEIRSRYPGAAWEEITLGGEHGALWERVAVVTDVALVRHALQAVRLLIPSDLRVFTTTQIPEALGWIAETTSRRQQQHRSTAAAAAAATGGAAGLRGNGGRVFRPPAQYLHHAL